MDKKKKILMIAIISIIVIGLVAWGVTSNKKVVSNSENTESGSNQNSATEEGGEPQMATEEALTEEELQALNEQPIKAVNGVNATEFEDEIKKLGYELYLDKSYDYFVEDNSIVLVDINESNINFSINDKANVKHEKIKAALQLLLPNEVDKLYEYLDGDIKEIAASLDNRTVSIIPSEDSITIEVSL